MPGRRARELCPHVIFVGGNLRSTSGSATLRSPSSATTRRSSSASRSTRPLPMSQAARISSARQRRSPRRSVAASALSSACQDAPSNACSAGRGRKAFAGLGPRSARNPNPRSCTVSRSQSALAASRPSKACSSRRCSISQTALPRACREVSRRQHRHGAGPVRRHAGHHQIDDAGCADFGYGYAGGNCRGAGAGSACRSSRRADNHAIGRVGLASEKAAGYPPRSASRAS